MAAETKPMDYRRLMRKVEQVVDELELGNEIDAIIRAVAESVIGKLRTELGIYGGRLYKRRGDAYVLQTTFGEAKHVPAGLEVPASYPPIEICLEERVVYMESTDPRIDAELEDRLGVREFAAVEVGDAEYLLAFNIAPGFNHDDILLSLSILRHSINQRIRQERMQEVFREARKIQASILPRRAPKYGRFDIYGRSEPMQTVGGDFFDYIPMTDKILGLAVADVSGHGLPAALQVRDVYTGLRMGLARDFKIVRTVERLNSIIHKSTLTSRFVAMFYGELEVNGIFLYVNAGHVPPFHLSADGSLRFLEEGGPVLGPLADATYVRGFVQLEPGDMLVFYTDGIVESCRGPCDGDRQEWGVERLTEHARRLQGRPAAEIVETIFSEVREFTGGSAPDDDRTVMVVTYPPDP